VRGSELNQLPITDPMGVVDPNGASP
jgi:hypothetical protein